MNKFDSVNIKIGSRWGWNVVQGIKCFLHKHEDLTLDSQNSWKRQMLWYVSVSPEL